jgi:hypothetical protein
LRHEWKPTREALVSIIVQPLERGEDSLAKYGCQR